MIGGAVLDLAPDRLVVHLADDRLPREPAAVGGSRKKVGDKSYSCWQKTEKADQAAAYVKACNTLKPL